jgi:hypothetical protein
MTSRRLRGTLVTALVTVLTLVAGAVGAAAFQAVSATFGLLIGSVVLLEGLAVIGVGMWLTRRGAARAEQARRAQLPPLPRDWVVPDYPPPDLIS